jgi:ABC-type lipoprotein export system ATPase subunit
MCCCLSGSANGERDRGGASRAAAFSLGSAERSWPGRSAVAGEQQRVALARALIFDPPIMLADEPTASLDARTGETVTTMLQDMAHEEGRMVIAVSHDPALIARADLLVETDRVSHCAR